MKKKFKNDKLKDILFVAILLMFYFTVLLILTKNGKYILVSEMDYSVQHYNIPDYFRKLFYDSHNLFPNFAFNLGAGENIYYLSYYGLFSPFIILSYFLPNISMLDYSIISMQIVIISSIILLYSYLRKNNYSSLVSFLSTFVFLCATPIIFHSHRHIMFINYLPFLILSFYGIDKFIEKNKSSLLIISITLMILSSYYFSVSGIVVLFIFAIFKYIRINDFELKKIMKFSFSFILRIIIAILITSILIIPTFYTLFSGRSSKEGISILELIRPDNFFCYLPYTMGLTIVSLVAVILMLFSKKENKFLSTILLLVGFFPIFNFILNGFLYINGKSLIPFILLVVITVADFFTIAFKYKNKILELSLIIIVLLTSGYTCITRNQKDGLVKTKDVNKYFYKNYDDIVKINDDNIYRTNSSMVDKTYINKIGDIREYKTTMYSSSYNNTYRDSYINLFKNPLNYRNKFMITSSNNIIYQLVMGEKYIFSKDELNDIYKKVNNYDDVIFYKNDYVMPLIYATDKIINENDFNDLEYPDTIINLIGNVVSSEKTNTTIRKTEKEELNIDKIEYNNLKYEEKNYGYYIESLKNGEIEITLNNDLNNKLLFVSFDILENTSCNNKDLTITINGITNKLTCKEWKYYNENTSFEYVFLPNSNKLEITFEKGKYKIGNISVRSIDFDIIKDINRSVTPFIFNKEKTKGDKIVGDIEVSNDSYVIASIPYDNGFNIYIDNEKVNYYKINNTFIGFDIKSGNHHIEITYKAPFRDISLVLSSVGIISFILLIVIEKKKK